MPYDGQAAAAAASPSKIPRYSPTPTSPTATSSPALTPRRAIEVCAVLDDVIEAACLAVAEKLQTAQGRAAAKVAVANALARRSAGGAAQRLSITGLAEGVDAAAAAADSDNDAHATVLEPRNCDSLVSERRAAAARALKPVETAPVSCTR